MNELIVGVIALLLGVALGNLQAAKAFTRFVKRNDLVLARRSPGSRVSEEADR